MSWPRSATRTGCDDSGETRYWYQVMSQAKVSTISEFTPESGVIDAMRLAERPARRPRSCGGTASR